MRARRLLSYVLLVSSQALLGAGCSPQPSFHFEGQLSELAPRAGVLGEDWTGPTGIVIDNLSKLNWLPEVQQVVARKLASQLGPQGIVGCADFTFRRADTRLENVTLRVFVFKTAARCDEWWAVKYESRLDYYRKVEGQGDRALESSELRKRIVSLGNVLLTCHQLHEGEEYVKLLDEMLRKLAAGSEA